MPKLSRERDSLVDRAAGAILELIRERALATGSALPTTAQLISEFGVSRTVVREALADLAGRGIVQRAGREYLVTSPGSDVLSAFLAFRTHQEGHDVLELMELREALEVRSARLAAERRTESDLAGLSRIFGDLESASSEDDLHDADVAFHRDLARIGRNGLVLLVLDALEPMLRQARRTSIAGWRMRDVGVVAVVDAHRAILECVRRGDPDAAAQAMAYHLAQTRADVEAWRGSAPYWQTDSGA